MKVKFSPFPTDDIHFIISCKWIISTILRCDYIFFRECLFQLINLFVIAARYPNPGPNALSVTALSTSYTPNSLVNRPYQFYQVEPHILLVLRKKHGTVGILQTNGCLLTNLPDLLWFWCYFPHIRYLFIE